MISRLYEASLSPTTVSYSQVPATFRISDYEVFNI